MINDSDGTNEKCEGLMRLAARYELDNLVVAGVFTHVSARTVLGDGRHRGFGHGPTLRDGGAQHCDDENYKFEKECETRSHCVSVRQP